MAPMTDRQRRFREDYRAGISRRYNGYVHTIVIFAVGITLIALAASRLDGAGYEWLLVIPVFLVGNSIEWFMHRYVMHKRVNVFGLRSIYQRHTREHHQYFTDLEPTINSVREFRIVFFPWRVLTIVVFGGLVVGGITGLIINPNAGLIVFIAMVALYLNYEAFHFCCHVPENWFVRNIPFVNTMRRHHTAHHNLGIMMKYNMNLTYPIMDWAMGTSDLRRGLVGHIFNGYSNKHVKEELKPIIEKFRVDHSRATLDGPILTPEEETAVEEGLARSLASRR